MSDEGWLRGRKAIAGYLDITPQNLTRYFKQRGCFNIVFDGRLMVAKRKDIDEWIMKRSKRICPYDIAPCGKD